MALVVAIAKREDLPAELWAPLARAARDRTYSPAEPGG
jgi:hypothetical protein